MMEGEGMVEKLRADIPPLLHGSVLVIPGSLLRPGLMSINKQVCGIKGVYRVTDMASDAR